MKLIRRLRSLLIYALLSLLFGYLTVSAFRAWRESKVELLPDHDYLNEISKLREEGKIAEAIAISSFVESQPGMPNRDAIIARKQEMEKEQASWLSKAKRFSSGVVFGKTDSMEAFAGTAVADIFVIGDVRDLVQQGINVAHGKEADSLIVGLSVAGAVISALALVPEPAEGAPASADVAVSVLKSLRKQGALTDDFAETALNLAKKSGETQKIGKFGELSQNMWIVIQHVPNGTLGTAMKEVRTLDDLKAVSEWSKAAPTETIVVLTVDEKNGLRCLKSNSTGSLNTLKHVLRKGQPGLSKTHLFIRGAKFFCRGRIQELLKLFSGKYLIVIVLGSFLLFLVAAYRFAFCFCQFTPWPLSRLDKARTGFADDRH